MQEKIENIIFDLGAVLVGLDSKRCVDAFEKIGAHDIAHFVAEHRVEDLFLDSEVGNINQEIFCDRVRDFVQKDIQNKDIIWAWNELLTGIPDKKKQRLLDLKQKGYRIFLLSNTNDMHWQKCANDFFPYQEQYTADDFFEKVFLSYEMRLIKPSLEIYRKVLAETGIEAEKTLFIDDNADNCKAANQLGIHTFVNKEPNDWLSIKGL